MSLKVVLLGSTGFLGSHVARGLVRLQRCFITPSDDLPLNRIVLFDLNQDLKLYDPVVTSDPRVEIVAGDLCDPEAIRRVLSLENGKYTHVTTIHLAALLSGNSEKNFDLGMKINLYGSLNVMERVRELSKETGKPQIYLFTSSDYVACFNDTNRKNPINEECFRLSKASYGAQKACMEILISDYTRKGFLDGRVVRVSAIIGKPGWFDSISFPYTGIFTQTLQGKDYECPLALDIPYPCSSLKSNVDNIIFLATRVNSDEIGFNRVVQIPAESFTLRQIWEETQKVAQRRGIRLGNLKVGGAKSGGGSGTISELSICPYVDCAKAKRLGCDMNVRLADIIEFYIDKYLQKELAANQASKSKL